MHLTQCSSCRNAFLETVQDKGVLDDPKAKLRDDSGSEINTQSNDLVVNQEDAEHEPAADNFSVASSNAESTFDPILSLPGVSLREDTSLQFSTKHLHEIKLLSMINKHQSPDYAFGEIMDWAKHASAGHESFQPTTKSYSRQMKQIRKLIGATHSGPRRVPVDIIVPGRLPERLTETIKLDVIVFPFPDMLASLLHDMEVNKLENLVVDKDNPFGKCKFPDNNLHEINSGKWYHDTYAARVTEPEQQFLCPIVFTMDKTVISEQPEYSVDAIHFTTSIFDMKTRATHKAWRPLAYIPPLEHFCSQSQLDAMSSDDKQFIYYQFLEAGLASFKETQFGNALHNITLPLGPYQKEGVHILTPLAFIIGDAQGGDKICGRRQYYNKTAARLSRFCDASPEHYDCVWDKTCKVMTQEEVVKALGDKDEEALARLFQLKGDNPFFELDLGCSKGGIFTAACPAEGLHVLEQGIIKRSNATFCHDILWRNDRLKLDQIVMGWCRLPGQHCFQTKNVDENPRVRFRDGVTSLTKLSGGTHVAQVFALVLAMLTKEGGEAVNKSFNIRNNGLDDTGVVEAFETLLAFWAWLKKDKYWEHGDSKAEEDATCSIETMIQLICTLLPRKSGNGWSIPKLHDLLHIAWLITMFGRHANVHTGRTEANHIQNSKRPARRTQKRVDTFDFQVAQRFFDNICLDQAQQQATKNAGEKRTYTQMLEDNKEKKDQPKRTGTVHPSSAKLRVKIYKKRNGNWSYEIQKETKRVAKHLPPPIVLRYLVKELEGRGKREGLVTFYSRWRLNGKHSFACDYSSKRPWLDNIHIDRGYRFVSATLRCIYAWENEEVKCIVHQCYPEKGMRSVLTKLSRFQYEDDDNDFEDIMDIYDNHEMEYDMEHVLNEKSKTESSVPVLSVITTSEIAGHVLLLPYCEDSKFVIEAKPQHYWADEFRRDDGLE